MKKVFISESPETTRKIGQKLAASLRPNDVVALAGQLGAGKTVFSQGLARGLGVKENVTSASFVLVQKFQGRIPFYHMDFYRLNAEEIETAGFEDLFSSGGVCVIEWADKDWPLLPENKIEIKIDYLDPKKRRLTISTATDSSKLKGLQC